MTKEPKHLDGLEEAWLELDAARQAGVFARTHLDATALVQRPLSLTRRQWAVRIAPVAAALIMAVGVGSYMFKTQIETLRAKAPMGTLAQADPDPCDVNFLHCFSGPTGAVLADCRPHDYDSDGDVDLADFGRFQSTCVRPVRTH